MLDHANNPEEYDLIEWKIKEIMSHEVPLPRTHSNCNGLPFNLIIDWENVEITNEPLNIIEADDLVSCAIYDRCNTLIDQPGWKRFNFLAKREKKILRLQNQAKLRRHRIIPKFKFGYQIPRSNDYDHASSIDKNDGNNKWAEHVKLEIDQQCYYDTYKDIGKGSSLKGHKLIRVYFVIDMKYGGRHRARLLSDGHLTDVPISSVYSGVFSLRGIILVLFVAELNPLDSWGADIGNSCSQSFTKEKVYIKAR